MRRVYDDTFFEEVKIHLTEALEDIALNPKTVTKYSYGMNRAEVYEIRKRLESVYGYKFGKNEHAHGIGNNNAIELIVETDYDEEQICGLLHLTDDMFGSVLAWITDIDGERRTRTIKIKG